MSLDPDDPAAEDIEALLPAEALAPALAGPVVSAPDGLTHARVLRLAAPIILANLAQPLVGIVGTVIAGHMPGTSYLAGVALGSAVLNLVFWNFIFLRKTTTGLAAQAFGSGDRRAQGDALWQALAIAAAVGAAVLLFIGPIIDLGVALIGGTPDVVEVARQYATIRFSGAVLVLANFGALGYLVGIQRPSLAFAAQCGGNVIHIGLAILFVEHLSWGIAGLAWAAVIGEAAGLGASLLLIVRNGIPWPGRNTFAAGPLRRLLTTNSDMLVRSLCVTSAIFWFTRMSAAEGAAVLAANAILLNFQTMLALVIEGFAAAGQVLVGAAFGRHDKAGIIGACWLTGQWATALGLLFSAIFFLAAAPIIAAFTNQAEIIAVAQTYALWTVLGAPIMAWAFLLDGLFLGATRTRDLRNSMAASLACFALAIAVIHQPSLGNHGLWAAYLIFFMARIATLGLCLRRQPLHSRAPNSAWG